MSSFMVYMAGPLFSQAERTFLEQMVEAIAKATNLDPVTDFFLPHRDSSELGKQPKRKEIFELDMQRLDTAAIAIGFLDGQDVDSGTCIELGYAYAHGKKIFGLVTDFRALYDADPGPERPNLMVWGVCEEGKTLFHDIDSLAAAIADYLQEHPELL